MEWIFLALAVVVVVFGVGLLFVNRARAAKTRALAPAPRSVPTRPAVPAAEPVVTSGNVGVLDRQEGVDAAEGDVVADVESDVVDPESADEIAAPSLRDRLARARGAFSGVFGTIRGRAGITAATWDELEESLIAADCGVGLTTEMLDELRAIHKTEKITDPSVLLDRLKDIVRTRLEGFDRELHLRDDGIKPSIWLFVGVNGVGKTTTIGKLGLQQSLLGHKVMMAAGDTFRAAAAEQLATWADRSDADIVRGSEGADPAAIIFDAVESAVARGHDLVLADTAGRLHTKVNLMEELRKVRRVAEKGQGRVSEVLLVVDATTGQNGLVQARQFTDAVEVTGVVLTKLDGSAKGGIVLAIQHELGIPVKLVGVGETINDLMAFDPQEFTDALFAH
jgi:fused signal recognition particle receptor